MGDEYPSLRGSMGRSANEGILAGTPGVDRQIVDSHSWGLVRRGSIPMVTARADHPTDPLALRPGRVFGLEGPTGLGLTRIGLSMLAEPSQHAPVVVVDVRGWVSPMAAWESGVRADRLTVVRCGDMTLWPSAVSALLEGVKAIYAEVPRGVHESVLRRLGALARTRDAAVVLRPIDGRLPSGIAYLRVRADEVNWNGAHRGHGRLLDRRITLELSGKGAAGTRRTVELEDDGTHPVRVVSGLAAPPARRAVG